MEDKKEVTQEEKKEVAIKNEHVNMVADFENGIYGSSDSFKMAYQMAKALSQSTIVPAHFQRNEANCLVAISQAQKMGIDPFTVMQNMYMIQGKMGWSSSFLIAMINASEKYDMELQFDEEEKDGKPYSCRCWTKKDGRKIDGVKVTMDMADDEGWTKKNGSKWKTLPALMLRYRSASFFAKLNCPELTNGFYTKEELLDKVLKLAKELVAAIEEEGQKNKVMLKYIPAGGKFDTGIGGFIVLEQKADCTVVITEGLYRKNEEFDDDCTDYKKSSLRELCDGEILNEFIAEYGEDNICENEAGLVTVDGQEVFGKLLTKVRPVTFDEGRKYNELLVNKELPDWYWTCTSWSTAERDWPYSVAVVSPSGGVNINDCVISYGVRPVCILKSNIFVSRVEED